MLIISKPDPSRCIDCCIHLSLLYFSKRLRHRQNFFEGSLSALIMQNHFDDYVLPHVGGWQRLRVCVFMKRLPFPEDVGLITCERRSAEGKCEETKGCFSFGDLV